MHDLGRDQQGRARLQRPDRGQRRIAEADTLSPLAQHAVQHGLDAMLVARPGIGTQHPGR